MRWLLISVRNYNNLLLVVVLDMADDILYEYINREMNSFAYQDNKNVGSVNNDVNTVFEHCAKQSSVPCDLRDNDCIPSRLCTSAFSFGHKLKKTTIARELKPSEKLFSCKVCGASFSRKQYFIEHKRIHKGEKPHSCEVCGKSFAWLSGLSKHKRTHRSIGEKHPYQVCGSRQTSFAQESCKALNNREHAQESSFLCQMWNNKSSEKSPAFNEQERQCYNKLMKINTNQKFDDGLMHSPSEHVGSSLSGSSEHVGSSLHGPSEHVTSWCCQFFEPSRSHLTQQANWPLHKQYQIADHLNDSLRNYCHFSEHDLSEHNESSNNYRYHLPKNYNNLLRSQHHEMFESVDSSLRRPYHLFEHVDNNSLYTQQII